MRESEQAHGEKTREESGLSAETQEDARLEGRACTSASTDGKEQSTKRTAWICSTVLRDERKMREHSSLYMSFISGLSITECKNVCMHSSHMATLASETCSSSCKRATSCRNAVTCAGQQPVCVSGVA